MEQNELKYPIKYGIMPIMEQIGWSPGVCELEREYGVVAYIVSKCYLVGEHKVYLSDGNTKIKYEVVFPYRRNEFVYDQFKRVFPEYNFNAKCINSFKVNELFDSFEEASTLAAKMNETLVGREIQVLSFDENIKEKIQIIRDKHQKTLDKYKEIEEMIEQTTEDMKVNSSNKKR